jgi:uncharacterized membrane protein
LNKILKDNSNGQSVSGDDLTQRNVQTIAEIERASHHSRTFGERVADGFAATVGSWKFIIAQSVLLALWVVLNLIAWSRHWDPYPFILLNLALSFQAAYASPIIMMSQNRQARLSERRNRLDLQINLLSEQENTQMLGLLRKIAERLEIEHDNEPNLDALGEATDPTKVVGLIDEKHKGRDAQSRP